MRRWIALGVLALGLSWGPYVYSELRRKPVTDRAGDEASAGAADPQPSAAEPEAEAPKPQPAAAEHAEAEPQPSAAKAALQQQSSSQAASDPAREQPAPEPAERPFLNAANRVEEQAPPPANAQPKFEPAHVIGATPSAPAQNSAKPEDPADNNARERPVDEGAEKPVEIPPLDNPIQQPTGETPRNVPPPPETAPNAQPDLTR